MNSDVLIYGSSLGNRGGTGVYLRRLLDGLSLLDTTGIRVVTGRGIFDIRDVPEDGYPGGIRKVLAENVRIPLLLASTRPGLVHFPAFGGRPPAGIPYVVTLHDLAFMDRPEWFPKLRSAFYRRHFASVSRGGSLVMVDSDFTGREAVRLLDLDPGLLRRVYLATPDFTESPRGFAKQFPSAGDDYLIFVGTVEPRKNVESLIDAWGELREELDGYNLVVAGRWGWGERSLRRRLRSEPGVIWTGMISGELLRSAVSGARLLVYPSLYEGFGLPPLEAASAGVPSVLGPAEALAEVYGELAAAYCGSSPRSIFDAVLEALEAHPDPDILRDFASRFSNRAMADRVFEVYGEASQ